MQQKHFGAICDPGTSHIMTMAAIGHQLLDRGHRFTLFQTPAVGERVSALGIPFQPLVESDIRTLNWEAASSGRAASIRGFLDYSIQSATMICDRAPAMLRRAEVDCLLADLLEPAAATVAEASGIPFVTICSAVPLHQDPVVPPDFLPWAYSTSWWARPRNRLAYAVRDVILRPLHKVLNGYRRQWGLKDYHRPDDSLSPWAQICQMVPEFDLPRMSLPECFHYVGPYWRANRNPARFSYHRLTGRPLIYAALGTGLGARTEIWQAIAEACLGLEADLLIALGQTGLAERMPPLAGNPIVVDYAPQRELLKRASLFITHAGLNSAMESLAAGVPMVAIPIMGDQFGVAARIAFSGVGTTVPVRDLRTGALHSAVRAALNNPRFRQRASDLKTAIQQTGGAEAAANIVEQVMATGKPVFR